MGRKIDESNLSLIYIFGWKNQTDKTIKEEFDLNYRKKIKINYSVLNQKISL